MNVSAISTIAPKHGRCTETIAGFPYSLPNNKTQRLPGRGHNSFIFENEASQMRGETHIKLCSEDLKEERSLGKSRRRWEENTVLKRMLQKQQAYMWTSSGFIWLWSQVTLF
jgi:hypothetical protein